MGAHSLRNLDSNILDYYFTVNARVQGCPLQLCHVIVCVLPQALRAHYLRHESAPSCRFPEPSAFVVLQACCIPNRSLQLNQFLLAPKQHL